MPTIRQYFYKSVKNSLLILASIIVLILACVVIDWFLPNQVHNGLVVISLHFIKEIGVAIAFAILLFLGYKAFKVFKTEKTPSQEFIKMTPTVIIWFVIIFSVANFIEENGDVTDCQKYNYNEKLNGGVKEFNGKKYTINICGSGVNNGHFFGDSMDTVQLTVLNEQGKLLAKRHYKVFWDGQPGHEPIAIEKDRLTYYDDKDQDGQRTIAIPPTFIDLIRARLPLIN